MLIVYVLGFALFVFNCFIRDLVRLFNVFSELYCERFNITRLLGHRCTEIARETHLATEHGAKEGKACQFQYCRSVRLQHR